MIITFPTDSIQPESGVGVDPTLADFPPSAASSHAARIGGVLIVLVCTLRILAFSALPRTCGHALGVVFELVLDSMCAEKRY